MRNNNPFFYAICITITTLLPQQLYSKNQEAITIKEEAISKIDNAEPEEKSLKVSDKMKLTPEQEEKIKKIIKNEQESLIEEFDTIVSTAIKQLEKVDSILEDMAQVVQNGLVKTKEKTKLVSQIKSLRKFINELKSNTISVSDVETLNVILSLNNAIIKHINFSIKKNLSTIGIFDIEQVITKVKTSTTDQMFYTVEENNKLLEKLDKSAQKVGLSLFNKMYRFLDSINKKANKYSLWSRSFKASVVGAFTFYSLYRLAPWVKRLKGITKITGEPPITNTLGHLQNKDQLGMLGKLEAQLTQITPVGSFFAVSLPFLLKSEWKKFREWSSNKISYLHHKMIGGVSAKKAEKIYNNGLTPKQNFDDIVGLEHVKKELTTLVKYIENPSRFEITGTPPEKGYLLVGKPGTGKTFTAGALANAISQAMVKSGRDANTFNFFPIEAADINEHGIDIILNAAKECSPCIIFIDEIDLLRLQRDQDSKKLSEFLNAMSGYISNNLNEQIILLAATNRPDNMDKALFRAGRFGKILHFDYPSFDERKEYLFKKLNPIVANINQFDIDKIARETAGCTYSAIELIIKKSFQQAKINGISVTQKDLENGLDEEIRHILPTEKNNLSDYEQKALSAQMASGALARILLDPAEKLACVTLNPVMKDIQERAVWDMYYQKQARIIEYGKIFTSKACDSINIDSKKDKENYCKIRLAPQIGEEIIMGSSGFSHKQDNLQKALEIALSLVSEGLYNTKLPKKIKQKYHEQALELLEKLKKEVRELLTTNKAIIKEISNALIENKTLYAEDIQVIVDNNSSAQQDVDQIDSKLDLITTVTAA